MLHGFYIPAFRIKRDAVPGMKNHAWFVAPAVGSYDLFCSSYCGAGHSGMISTVEAVPEAAFLSWLEQQQKPTGAKHGLEILEKYGCLACHSLDGTQKVGPTFKGIWGRQVTVVTNNVERTETVDENYLRRSVREPNADVVKGFPAIMPAMPLTDKEIEAIEETLEENK